MPPIRKRGLYRKYLHNSNCPLPRTTEWERRKQEQLEQNEKDNVTCNMPEQLLINEDESQIIPVYTRDETQINSETDEIKFMNESDKSFTSSFWNNNSNSNNSNVDDESSHLDGNYDISEEENDSIPSHLDDNSNIQNGLFDRRDLYNRSKQCMERQPLYIGAQLSLDESLLLIMAFIVRWGLEEKSIEHLLRLIDIHLPVSIQGSKYLFLKNFEFFPSNNVMYTCPECHNFLSYNDVEIECACGHHCVIDKIKEDGNFFIQLSIKDQIQEIMENHNLVKLMRKECRENDVVSGKVYKRLRNKGIIGDDDITLQWNIDGVSPFKSSKLTFWPIQACINELPFHARRENMLLCGLYCGKQKPNVNSFLKPFVSELKDLHRDGMECFIAGRDKPQKIKVHTLLSSVDSVARPMLQGINQFNGRYGCSFCLRKGKTIVRGNGKARVYIGKVAQLRTSQQHIDALERLEEYNQSHRIKKKHIQGVKFASVLLLLPKFDIIKSFVPDYLHAGLEGTVKTFLNHWIGKDSIGKEWHLNKEKKKILNERLLSIKPPVEITRAPQEIDKLRIWKASELRSFLLYYSLVCLKELLPNRHLKHWFLFVYSMTVFLKEIITRDEFMKAKKALNKFVVEISYLYPNCSMLYTFNVHLMLHIPKAVEDFGGLWASSTFPYEHFNGVLTTCIKGTRRIPQQICRSYFRLRQLSRMKDEVFSSENASQIGKEIFESLLQKFSTNHHSLQISEKVRLFGVPKNYSLSLVDKVAIQNLMGFTALNICKSFRRLIYCGTVFHADAYNALTVRDNSIAMLKDGVIINIKRILLIEDGVNKHCVLLGEIFDICSEELCQDRDLNLVSSSFISICQNNGRTIATLPHNIVSKCIKIPYGDKICITSLVNNIERD